MTVIAIATALTKCPIASQIPNNNTQMTLPTRAPLPALGLSTIVRPNGHNKGDGDDEQEADQRRDQISDGHPEAAEYQPDDVQDQAHISSGGSCQPTEEAGDRGVLGGQPTE
jgi:hypothetical protein